MTNKKRFLFFSFIAGFSTMVIELTAARIISPMLGSSIYTWTSVIGIVLLGSALGNHFGGKVIDKRNSELTGAIFFWLAGISVLFIPVLSMLIKDIGLLQMPLWAMVVLTSAILFIVPSFFLGLIYPSIIKLYLHNLSSAGKEAGSVSATWATGSILGTFLTGFVFIGYIGSFGTLIAISMVLFFCSLWLFPKNKLLLIFSFFYLIVFFTLFFIQNSSAKKSSIVFEKESNYFKIRVVDENKAFFRKTRFLFLDTDTHSVESYDESLSDVFTDNYTDIYPVFSIFNRESEVNEIAVIGGGSMAISENFKKYYSNANVFTAEIDPLVTETASKYFRTSSHVINNTSALDGRLFLLRSEKKFDIIFSDAYNSFISVPWHLTTKEFFKLAKNKLEPDGAFAINFISAQSGKESGLYQSMLATFSSIFDNYYVFSYGGKKQDGIQNIVLVGLNSSVRMKNEEIKTKLSSLPNGKLLEKHFQSNIKKDGSAIILTDNFAPTDRLMIPAIDRYFPSYIGFFKNFF